MTYYYINEKGLIDKKVGGDPPSNIFVAVSPDGIMRKFENGSVKSVIPSSNINTYPLKDTIEERNAAMLLGITQSGRNKKKSKSKSKRKCRCK